jgi:hypothetical protein
MVKAVDLHPMGLGFESCCPQFFFYKNYYQIGGFAAACKCNVAPSSSLKWHEIVIPTCKQIYISKLFSKVEINLFTIIWLHLITKVGFPVGNCSNFKSRGNGRFPQILALNGVWLLLNRGEIYRMGPLICRNSHTFMYSLPTISPWAGQYSGQRVHKIVQISAN